MLLSRENELYLHAGLPSSALDFQEAVRVASKQELAHSG